jgi:hypothetical protein
MGLPPIGKPAAGQGTIRGHQQIRTHRRQAKAARQIGIGQVLALNFSQAALQGQAI